MRRPNGCGPEPMEETMGLIAGFSALVGLLMGLTLIVVWAGSLERWVERQEIEVGPLEGANGQETVPRAA